MNIKMSAYIIENMANPSHNLSFSLEESCKQDNPPTYDELLQEVDLMEMSSNAFMDDYIAQEVDYNTNYTRKELNRIAAYYKISKRKKNKEKLVEDIVIFEKDPDNLEKAYRRKKLWSYLEEIEQDTYLRQFIILD